MVNRSEEQTPPEVLEAAEEAVDEVSETDDTQTDSEAVAERERDQSRSKEQVKPADIERGQLKKLINKIKDL
jgi:hypothetical protein